MADIWGRLDATADNRMPSHRLMDWVWGALPQQAQQAFAPWGQLMNPMEWTPGAGVRDLVNSSGDMTRATMAGDPMGMLGAGAGMIMGGIGAVPGGKIVTGSAKAASRAGELTLKEIVALADSNPNLFVRWSEGPQYDMAKGAASTDKITGARHPGLSARALEQAMTEQRAASVLGEYGYLRGDYPNALPHIYEGKTLGKDSDGYPSIQPSKYLGTLSPADVARIDNDLSGARRGEIRDRLAGMEWNKMIAQQQGRDPAEIERVAEGLRAELSRLESFHKGTDASRAAIKALEPDKWGYFKSAVPGTAGADLNPRAFNLDNEKFSIELSKRLATDLLRDFGMKRQGSSKWSHYGVDRETGSSLRVSNHAAQNLGSLGANTGREMSVVVDPAAGELVLASPAIRTRTGLDEVRLELPDDEFGKLATPEGRAWLLDILKHGGTR